MPTLKTLRRYSSLKKDKGWLLCVRYCSQASITIVRGFLVEIPDKQRRWRYSKLRKLWESTLLSFSTKSSISSPTTVLSNPTTSALDVLVRLNEVPSWSLRFLALCFDSDSICFQQLTHAPGRPALNSPNRPTPGNSRTRATLRNPLRGDLRRSIFQNFCNRPILDSIHAR